MNLLRHFGEQGSSHINTNVVNGVDTARHGLILCQHGATAYTDLLEANFRYLHRLFMQTCDLLGTRVSKNLQTQIKL